MEPLFSASSGRERLSAVLRRTSDLVTVDDASAAHYWDLTEQIFRAAFVHTARPARQTQQVIQEVPFSVHHLRSELLFGTRAVWRRRLKIELSDIHRTVIDMLDKPGAGGGIRHLAECLGAHVRRDDADRKRLIDHAERIGNGAIFKRLGFLTERAGAAPELVAACAARLTQGNAKLDAARASPRLVRRWRLWVPERWMSGAAPR